MAYHVLQLKLFFFCFFFLGGGGVNVALTSAVISQRCLLVAVVLWTQAMLQTQDMTPHPIILNRHRADLSCYPLMWNVTLKYTSTHFIVLDMTQPGNPSPTFHTHTSERLTLWSYGGSQSDKLKYQPINRFANTEWAAIHPHDKLQTTSVPGLGIRSPIYLNTNRYENSITYTHSQCSFTIFF